MPKWKKQADELRWHGGVGGRQFRDTPGAQPENDGNCGARHVGALPEDAGRERRERAHQRHFIAFCTMSYIVLFEFSANTSAASEKLTRTVRSANRNCRSLMRG